MGQAPSVLPEGVDFEVVTPPNDDALGVVTRRQGYIVFPPTHPWRNGMDASEYYVPDFPDVHGGITYIRSGSEFVSQHPGLDVPDDSVVVGWDYNHFISSDDTALSYGVLATFEIIRDEVLMVYAAAMEALNNPAPRE